MLWSLGSETPNLKRWRTAPHSSKLSRAPSIPVSASCLPLHHTATLAGELHSGPWKSRWRIWWECRVYSLYSAAVSDLFSFRAEFTWRLRWLWGYGRAYKRNLVNRQWFYILPSSNLMEPKSRKDSPKVSTLSQKRIVSIRETAPDSMDTFRVQELPIGPLIKYRLTKQQHHQQRQCCKRPERAKNKKAPEMYNPRRARRRNPSSKRSRHCKFAANPDIDNNLHVNTKPNSLLLLPLLHLNSHQQDPSWSNFPSLRSSSSTFSGLIPLSKPTLNLPPTSLHPHWTRSLERWLIISFLHIRQSGRQGIVQGRLYGWWEGGGGFIEAGEGDGVMGGITKVRDTYICFGTILAMILESLSSSSQGKVGETAPSSLMASVHLAIGRVGRGILKIIHLCFGRTSSMM